MTSDERTSTILSHRHFEGLKHLMRDSSANIQVIAQDLRYAYGQKFKNTAKAKAAKKGLSISIERAKGCPQTAVSVVPLPILDTTPTPQPLVITIPPSSAPRRRRQRRTPTHIKFVPLSVQRGLSPLSASVIQVALLPATPFDTSVLPKHRPVLPRLDMSSVPSISISYFSASATDEKMPTAVPSTTDDGQYVPAPAAPAPQVKELSDVPVDADFWEDIDMSSSSRSSSLGPETPCDSGDESLFMVRIRKRKTTDEEDEEVQEPKHVMKKRWSISPSCRNGSSRLKGTFMASAIVA